MFRRMLSAAVLALILAGTLIWTLDIQPIRANPGLVTIKVQYQDGCPRSSAIVKEVYNWPHIVGVTNESGYVSESGYQPSTIYRFKAYWHDLGQQFGPQETIVTDGSGDGNVTITGSYEITPPTIEILSPQNMSYTTSSVDLTFTVYDYSPISWMGYSLDNQSNVTVTGNTSLTGLSLGQHNVIVYANDTYGNMGSSERVYFTRIYGCVTIKVQYKDGYPRDNAFVIWRNYTEWEMFGVTNKNGIATLNDTLSPGPYEASARYPNLGTQFGEDIVFWVNSTGYGSATITANYEITPPVIEVLSPKNMTYTNTSLPLNFTVYDFSSISWIGYSLDNQANVTITGNTTLTGLSYGFHDLIIYANDTFGNSGTCNKIFFSIYTANNSLNLRAHIGGTTDPPPGTYSYQQGQSVQVQAIPNSEFVLDHWELDNVIVGSSNPIEVTMNSDHTLHAVFRSASSLWDIEITSIEAGVWQNGNWIPKTEFVKLEVLEVKMTFAKQNDEVLDVCFAIVAFDRCYVPISCKWSNHTLSGIISGELYFHMGTIPKTVYLGEGVIYANAFDPEPLSLYCPEVQMYFELRKGNILSVSVASPVNLLVTDPNGLRVGYDPNSGKSVSEILGAYYSGPDAEPEIVIVPNPVYGNYVTRIVGTETGTYNYALSRIAGENETYSEEHKNIEITQNEMQTMTSTIYSIADINLTNLMTYRTIVGQGLVVPIDVNVSNHGCFNEQVNVTIYANTTEIGTRTFNLTNGSSTIITFTWNTSGFVKGNYTVKAIADTLPGEIDIEDNTFIDGWVIVTIPGDVDGDGVVGGLDAGLLGYYWPPQPYYPNCDIDCDGVIGGLDAGLIGYYWGTTNP